MNRLDFEIIKNVIKDNSRILDVGCENGDLLKFLDKGKKIDGRGLEISQKNVNICVKRGLSVVQGDADKDLISFPSKSFDLKPNKLIFFDRAKAFAIDMDVLILDTFPGP